MEGEIGKFNIGKVRRINTPTGGIVEIFDNKISEETQLYLKNNICESTFPWYYIPETVGAIKENDKYQMVHLLFVDGESTSEFAYDIIKCFEFLPEFKTHKVLRAKLNMNFPYKKENIELPHVDSANPNHISYLYYVNESDGPTLFYPYGSVLPYFYNETNEDKASVDFKQGRLVRFPSNLLHSSSLPYKYDSRVVLNLMFEPQTPLNVETNNGFGKFL